MAYQPQRIQVGAATVTIINAGDLRFRLADEMAVPEQEWRPTHADLFTAQIVFPSQCFHIAAPGGLSVMVDAGRYEVPEGSGFAIPGYTPPPPLPEQLAAAGIRPEDVRYVVITHAHWDHFNGLTSQVSGHVVPTFQGARHLLGRGDGESDSMRAALAKPDSLESRTLGVIQRAGLLDLVDGERDLGAGVRVMPMPGESPGHQVVRVTSDGQTLYCLGDLYHHQVEVERPHWMAEWAERDAMLESRARLAELALAENALLTAAHIAGVGRITREGAGVRWVDAS